MSKLLAESEQKSRARNISEAEGRAQSGAASALYGFCQLNSRRGGQKTQS